MYRPAQRCVAARGAFASGCGGHASPIEAAVQLFHRRLREAAGNVSRGGAARVHAAAAMCMRTCLAHGSARDALDVYYDYCSAGLCAADEVAMSPRSADARDRVGVAALQEQPLIWPPRSPSLLSTPSPPQHAAAHVHGTCAPHDDRVTATTTSHTASSSSCVRRCSVNGLALQALQQLPDRVHQHHVLMQLLACETRADDVAAYIATSDDVVTPDTHTSTPAMQCRVDAAGTPSAMRAPPRRVRVCASWSRHRGDGPMALCDTNSNKDGGVRSDDDGGGVRVAATWPASAGAAAAAAAQCRVRVLQRLHILRRARLLDTPIGLDYALAEMQHVVRSADICRDADATVLVALSSTVLRNVYSQYNNAAAAPRYGHVSSTLPLSAAQEEQLLHMDNEAATRRRYRGLRGVLRMLVRHLSDWDAVLLRRVALTLWPPHSVASRNRRGRDGHDGTLCTHPTDSCTAPRRQRRQHGDVVQPSLSPRDAGDDGERHACVWRDAAATAASLFAPCCLPHVQHRAHEAAVLRVEQAMWRRTRHDVVVPDAAFVLTHFDVLRRLARHREVVLTHSVLLALVRAATSDRYSRRFRVRATLHTLMRAASRPARLAANASPPPTPSLRSCGAWLCNVAMSSCRRHRTARPCRDEQRTMRGRSGGCCCGGGVTLLGLQDELALLASCRAWAARVTSYHDTSDTSAPDVSTDDCCAYATVCAAAQLRRMLDCHDHQTTLLTSMRACAAHSSSSMRVDDDDDDVDDDDVDDDDVDDDDDDDGAAAGSSERRCTSASFARDSVGTRKRHVGVRGSHHAAAAAATALLPSSVVVATTTSLSRRLAYAMSVPTYPPVTTCGW